MMKHNHLSQEDSQQLKEKLLALNIIRYAKHENVPYFTLCSGKHSPYYVDARHLFTYPEVCNHVVDHMYDCIQNNAIMVHQPYKKKRIFIL